MKSPNIITRQELQEVALINWPQDQVTPLVAWGLRLAYYSHYVEYLERHEFNKRTAVPGFKEDKNSEETARKVAGEYTIHLANKYRDEGRSHHSIFHPILISKPEILEVLTKLCAKPIDGIAEAINLSDILSEFDFQIFKDGELSITSKQCHDIRRQFGHDSEYFQSKYPDAEQNEYVQELFIGEQTETSVSGSPRPSLKNNSLKKDSLVTDTIRRSGRSRTFTRGASVLLFSPIYSLFTAKQKRNSFDGSEDGGSKRGLHRDSKTSDGSLTTPITLGDVMDMVRAYNPQEIDINKRSIFSDIAAINASAGMNIAELIAVTLFPNMEEGSIYPYLKDHNLRYNGANEFATTISNLARKIHDANENNNPLSLVHIIQEIIDYAPSIPFRGEGHLNIMRDSLFKYIQGNPKILDQLAKGITAQANASGQNFKLIKATTDLIKKGGAYEGKPNDALIRYFIDESFYNAIRFAHDDDLRNFRFSDKQGVGELLELGNGNYNCGREIDGINALSDSNSPRKQIKAIMAIISDHQPGGFIYKKYENFMDKQEMSPILFDTFESLWDDFKITREDTQAYHEEYGIKAPICVKAHIADVLQVFVNRFYDKKTIDFSKLSDDVLERSFNKIKGNIDIILPALTPTQDETVNPVEIVISIKAELLDCITDGKSAEPAHKRWLDEFAKRRESQKKEEAPSPSIEETTPIEKPRLRGRTLYEKPAILSSLY